MSLPCQSQSRFQPHSVATPQAWAHSPAPPPTCRELFSILDEKFPALKPHLRDPAGEVRRFLNIYVNEEDIRFLGPSYAFQDGDEILLVPSIAGGSH